MLQKIFSQEIRFKKDDGSEFEEWEKVTVDSIFDIITPSKVESVTAGKYKVVNMGSITKNGKLITSLSCNYSESILEIGDLIMPKDDIGGGLIIGRTAYINKNNEYVASDHIFVLKINNSTNYSKFFHYQINSSIFRNNLLKTVTGSAQLGLRKYNLLKMNLYLPNSKEQEKIADLLSKHDLLIENSKQKLESTKELKKGLLQKMFV